VAHAADPAEDLYFPAAHGAQDAPSGPVYAALQTQAVASALPAGALESLGQCVQACAPAVDLYVLLAQGVQAAPAGPVYAALQTQASWEELAPGETAFAGQGVQAEAPLADWYDDAGHAWHAVEPTTLL